MAATVDSLFDTHQKRIEERLSKTIEVFLQHADPVWRETVLSSQGVGSVDALGRGMEVTKFFQNAIAGVIESGAPRSDWTTFGDPSNLQFTDDILLHQITQTLPDAMEDPSGVPIKLRVPMRSIFTNLKMTLGERQAEALPAFIGSITAPRMVAFTRNLSRRVCSAWYTSQADNYRLAGLGSSTGDEAYTISGSNKTILFYPSNRAVSRFAKGDRVDIYRNFSGTPVRMNDTNVTAGGVVAGDATGQTFSTRIQAIVVAVNKLQGTVLIKFNPNTDASKFATTGSLASGQLSTDSYVVWANSSKGGAALVDIPGLNSWLKFGGSTNAEKRLLGGEALGSEGDGIINVETHPQFMSFYKAVNGVLTEHLMNLYLDRVQEAFEDDGHFIDTLVTTQGVIRAAAAQKYARELLDRTGRLSSLAMEGEDGKGMVHHHNGREYKLWVSRWQEYGTMHGYRRQGNWTRYTPPTTPGSQSMPGTEAGIPFEFLVPSLTGLPTTKWPVPAQNGQLTDASQMPGHLRMTLVPEAQVRGLKLASITEETVYSDPTS